MRMGYPLDLKNPQTFNEKIQWLKLNGNLEQYTNLVDKYTVRKYISDTIGEQYLIPLLGVWDRFDDIDFTRLPEQFVLKCNHDYGSVILCKDKSSFDKNAAKSIIDKHLKLNRSYLAVEPQYKNIQPKVLCEKFMTDESGIELKDYKIFCFHGIPKLICVNYGRPMYYDTGYCKSSLFDPEWNYIPASINLFPSAPDITIEKPVCFEQMLDLAKILSKEYSHVRVDFYVVSNQIYFGELTFTHCAGFVPFEPREFDQEMGNWWKLPVKP